MGPHIGARAAVADAWAAGFYLARAAVAGWMDVPRGERLLAKLSRKVPQLWARYVQSCPTLWSEGDNLLSTHVPKIFWDPRSEGHLYYPSLLIIV